MIAEKLGKEELFHFIKKFFEEFGVVANSGFLAGYFKVTTHTINRRLSQLEEEKRIIRIKAKEKNVTYKIL